MISELAAVVVEPERAATWGSSAVDHPMREVTRAVAFDPDGWTPERQARVVELFDSLAPEWNTRDVAGRELPMLDALDRGLAAAPPADRGVAVELGGGTGLYSGALAEHFSTLVTVDISTEMIRLVPAGAALPVQGDGSRLPLADGSIDALVLVNMFLFPTEVGRVLAATGVVVWVNSRGAETPIHLTADEVDQALPGAWDGVSSAAGWGTWSVHWRA
ncbi:class I SAM-dependent methyltransferase [Aquihabitans sp. McL0605]|uniref:class I SAM-dependent methyltransferase n=1 Tax=Aquihabitans sp. McL0605 TaxID=3415671 RepID=UPI003CE93423